MEKSKVSDHLLSQKKSELLLYSIGNEYAAAVSDETDALLEEYSNLEVPESLDSRVSGLMEQSELNARKKQRHRRISKFVKRAAIIVVSLGLLTAGVTMSVEAFRVRLFNIIIEVREKFSLIRFATTSPVDLTDDLPADWSGYYPTVLPDGYKFSSASQHSRIQNIIFVNSDFDEIYFSQGSISSDLQLDTENAEVSEIKINGMEGLIVVKEELCAIVWHDNINTFYLDGYVDKSLLTEVAESIIKK